MRLPSVKTLESIFGLRAKEARTILEMNRAQLVETEAGSKRVRECLNPPDTVDLRMHVLNRLGHFHGVESVKVDRHYADYLNAGDSYAPTLIYWNGRYRVQSYGDFIEIQERYMPKRRRY
jgi:hypothetical protein